MLKLASLTLCTVLLAPVAALAATHNLAGTIDVLQATTCAVSSAQGSVTATLDDVSGAFSYTIGFGNNSPGFNDGVLDQSGALPNVETVAHFHIAPPGVPGGIAIGIPLGSPVSGGMTLISTQVTDVLAGLWYVNIHSTNCGGGEIRGQLLEVIATPALPTWGWLLFGVLALGGVGLLSRRAFLKS